MRIHDDISGYILTEFTDIEWEFNGVLDYLRRDKAISDRLAAVNGSTLIRVEPTEKTVEAGPDNISVSQPYGTATISP